ATPSPARRTPQPVVSAARLCGQLVAAGIAHQAAGPRDAPALAGSAGIRGHTGRADPVRQDAQSGGPTMGGGLSQTLPPVAGPHAQSERWQTRVHRLAKPAN